MKSPDGTARPSAHSMMTPSLIRRFDSAVFFGAQVNKLRKSADEGVRTAAAELLRKWKALAGTGKASANSAPSAEPSAEPSSGVKRAGGASAGEGEAKRAKSSDGFDDGMSALDSALSSQAAPRKASLKPDHLKARRPVQQLATSALPSRAGRTGSDGPVSAPAKSITSPPGVKSPRAEPSKDGSANKSPNAELKAPTSAPAPTAASSTAAATPGGVTSAPAPPASAPSRPPRRRISWATPEKLVEVRRDKSPR